jgi:hypothetical protein
LIGKYLKHINFNALVESALSFRSGIANSDLYLLRLVDQYTLHEHDAPVRHSAQGYASKRWCTQEERVWPRGG